MSSEGLTITKNKITKIALEKTKCKELSNLFTGATAVAFSDDAIISARILSKFAKTNERRLQKVLGVRGSGKDDLFTSESRPQRRS